MGKPVHWRAPDDVREWLERQPGGISYTLETMVRAAMGQRATPREIAQEAVIAELRAQVERYAAAVSIVPQKPAQTATEGGEKWSGFSDDE